MATRILQTLEVAFFIGAITLGAAIVVGVVFTSIKAI
jgi:hypothetical protein